MDSVNLTVRQVESGEPSDGNISFLRIHIRKLKTSPNLKYDILTPWVDFLAVVHNHDVIKVRF